MENLTAQGLFKYLEGKGISEETRKKLEGKLKLLCCIFIIIIKYFL